MSTKHYFAIWLVILFFELGYLFDLTHRVHNSEDTLVVIVVIAVTLVVGNAFIKSVKK
ncbi:hypothetical protein [Bacillus sp. FJAT-28004]|uniref:hypothetical protein n=1 Tax=Bacillus sp. FJAT-28004 TaxID=1679165 RepID=UPI000AC4B7E0|nr:hypothetical protein [Bacillus sp. FJAT-28004]